MKLNLPPIVHEEFRRFTLERSRPLIGVPTWFDSSVLYPTVSIYAMNRIYLDALQASGGVPVLIPLNLDQQSLRHLFGQLDGLLLAGGEDIAPQQYNNSAPAIDDSLQLDRDATELLLTQWALACDMPILGICRGMQLINVALGGTLYQDLASQRPESNKHDFFAPQYERSQLSHGLEVEPDSHLATILGKSTNVNSLHHQGIKHVGKGLRVVAWATDGLPEALEAVRNSWVFGVQWHPEALMSTDPRQADIFQNFINYASEKATASYSLVRWVN